MLLPSASENPDGLRTAITSIIFTILSGLFLVLRVYNRIYVLKGFAVDDWIILAGYVCRSN